MPKTAFGNLFLKIADLSTERRLGCVQLLLGCCRKAASLGGGDNVAKMPKIHVNRSMPRPEDSHSQSI
jgi:hypothetical protein